MPTSLIARLLAFACALLPARAVAEEALVAVAANFSGAMAALEARFEAQTGHDLVVTTGSSGKLYAQIANGAPIDMLLAADAERPRALEAAGLAAPGGRFVYALGRLALWSRDPTRIGADGAETLRNGSFRRIALANPDLAPFGAAALEVMDNLGVAETLRPRIVVGENVAQAYAMAASGAAEIAFVARAQIVDHDKGSRFDIPAALHRPILQEGVVLARAAENEAALAFAAFLQGEEARALIAQSGYDLP